MSFNVSKKVKRNGGKITYKNFAIYLGKRFFKILLLFTPPLLPKLLIKLFRLDKKKRPALPELPKEFSDLPRGHYGLYKLIKDYNFESVLDVGSGANEHAKVLANHGKLVTALDFGTSVYAVESDQFKTNGLKVVEADFYKAYFNQKFDCVWASHVLEHQPDPGIFIRRCMDLTEEGGIIAITVPPLKHEIVGGHLTLWNAGILLYQLVFNGLNCRDAAICTYGYNITIIIRNIRRGEVGLTWDSGDIQKLKEFFPGFVDEPFDGDIVSWNW